MFYQHKDILALRHIMKLFLTNYAVKVIFCKLFINKYEQFFRMQQQKKIGIYNSKKSNAYGLRFDNQSSAKEKLASHKPKTHDTTSGRDRFIIKTTRSLCSKPTLRSQQPFLARFPKLFLSLPRCFILAALSV